MEILTKEIIRHCPECGEVMVHDKDKDFWQCPKGCGEWWRNASKLAELEYQERARAAAAELRRQLLWSLGRAPTVVLPAGPPKPGGGSRNRSGRKRRKKIRKPLMTERYLLW